MQCRSQRLGPSAGYLQRCVQRGQRDCSPCTDGTYTCSGRELSRCTAPQTWSSVACNSVLSCNSALEMPACNPRVCEAGEFRCNEFSTLERCRSDGGKWEFVEQCKNYPLCNPKATRCQVPACAVSDSARSTRCRGDELQACRDDLTGWDQKMVCPPGTCDPKSGCLPLPCSNGAYRCNDVALEQCVASSWAKISTCETTALCDASQRKCN